MSSERFERAIRQAAQSKFSIDEVIEATVLAFGDIRKEFRAEIDALKDEIDALKKRRAK